MENRPNVSARSMWWTLTRTWCAKKTELSEEASPPTLPLLGIALYFLQVDDPSFEATGIFSSCIDPNEIVQEFKVVGSCGPTGI